MDEHDRLTVAGPGSIRSDNPALVVETSHRRRYGPSLLGEPPCSPVLAKLARGKPWSTSRRVPQREGQDLSDRSLELRGRPGRGVCLRTRRLSAARPTGFVEASTRDEDIASRSNPTVSRAWCWTCSTPAVRHSLSSFSCASSFSLDSEFSSVIVCSRRGWPIVRKAVGLAVPAGYHADASSVQRW